MEAMQIKGTDGVVLAADFGPLQRTFQATGGHLQVASEHLQGLTRIFGGVGPLMDGLSANLNPIGQQLQIICGLLSSGPRSTPSSTGA
jgi:hypothetical protein